MDTQVSVPSEWTPPVQKSKVVELLAGSLDPIDSEVTHVLRGLVRRGVLNEQQGELALEDLTQLALTRFPADWLRTRMWELRHNLSAYDATYVALTEMTDATALLTTDARLANAPAPSATSHCCAETPYAGDPRPSWPGLGWHVPLVMSGQPA